MGFRGGIVKIGEETETENICARSTADSRPFYSLPLGDMEAPRLLLVDDDPIFGKIMTRLAEQSRVNLTCCRSLDELGQKVWWNFHAGIIDYDLGTANGIELIQTMEKTLGTLPVILVSQGNAISVPISQWPTSIKAFIHKTLGHVAILEAALAAHDLAHDLMIRKAQL